MFSRLRNLTVSSNRHNHHNHRNPTASSNRHNRHNHHNRRNPTASRTASSGSSL